MDDKEVEAVSGDPVCGMNGYEIKRGMKKLR